MLNVCGTKRHFNFLCNTNDRSIVPTIVIKKCFKVFLNNKLLTTYIFYRNTFSFIKLAVLENKN